MVTYVGFSTLQIDAVRKTQTSSAAGGSGTLTNPIKPNKKFRMVDEELVIQDFLNALNTPQGQKPGMPSYGTTLWSNVYEPNTLDTQIAVETEVKRVAGQDPRLILNSITSYPQDNGILLEIELAIVPFNVSQQLAILFDTNAGKASKLMPGV